jgi:hypothetical protein
MVIQDTHYPFMCKLIDVHGWGAWGPGLIAFSLFGGILMLTMWHKTAVVEKLKT